LMKWHVTVSRTLHDNHVTGTQKPRALECNFCKLVQCVLRHWCLSDIFSIKAALLHKKLKLYMYIIRMDIATVQYWNKFKKCKITYHNEKL
jgi:hypothetical protein